MPELPDLVYLANRLQGTLPGRTVCGVAVREPVVLRVFTPGGFEENLRGRTFRSVTRRGPFLEMWLTDRILVMHLMLAGRLAYYGSSRTRPPPGVCFSLSLDTGAELTYSDEKRMGKIYLDELAPGGGAAHAESMPMYTEQGVRIDSEAFTSAAFGELIRGKRQQVRVFLMDQRLMSAIGNAYADEILFDARIHPKTRCTELGLEEVERLYQSVRRVIAWGIREVAEAAAPLEVKVRDHLKVRGRKGESCPACGTTIRRASVLGYDTFFCPSCQKPPASALRRSVPWERLS